MRDDGKQLSADNPLVQHLWLSAVLDHVPIAIGVFDDQGGLIFANRRYAEAPDGRAEAGNSLACLTFSADGRPTSEGVYPCVRLLNPQGVGTETAASVRFQRRARDWGPHFISFAQSSSNAIIIADPEGGTIDYLNPAAHELWSSSPAQHRLTDWEASIHPDDRHSAAEHRRLAQTGQPQRFEYRITAHSGEVIRHVRECCFLISAEGGTASAIGAIVEDISPSLQIYLIQQQDLDDSQITEDLRHLAHGMKAFANAAEFLDLAEILQPGCVIVDLRKVDLPLEKLLEILAQRPSEMQVIFIGAENTAASKVIAALKAGASDYLIEPDLSGTLQAALHKACRPLWDWQPRRDQQASAINKRLLTLPRREREVLLALVAGGTNKTIARSLKLSPRTVEVHRSHLMQRLNVKTLTELLHLAHSAGLGV